MAEDAGEDGAVRAGARDPLVLGLMPPAGKEKPAAALDFPGVRFVDENITTKPHQETQVVVESLRKNTVHEVRPQQEAVEEVAEVDWLGVPLAASTLPDYTSMYRHNYPDYSGGAYSTPGQEPGLTTGRARGRELYEQFEGVGWVARDTVPAGQVGGYVKKGGQVGRALLHPQSDRWSTPATVVERLRRTDPMEYLNLCDPLNKIPSERLMYQWVMRDQAAVDERVTVGRSCRTSGFTANSSPHLPPAEDRSFYSVYANRSGNCRPSTGRLKTQCVEAILFEEVISTGSSSSSYKTSPNMDLPSTSNGLQGKFLRRCTNCKQCVHVRSNVCKFCQCDFRNSRELMKKEEEARFLLKGKKALERNKASRVLRRIENQLTYLRGCGYESIVIYYKKGPARVTHGILPNNVIQEEDKKIFTTNFFLSRTRKLDADKLTLGSEGDSDNALEKNPDELQVQQVHKVQKVPQVQEIQQLQKVPQVEHLQKVPPVQQGLPLAILQKQQEVQVVKFEPQVTTPGKQCSNNGMGILKYLRKQVKKDKQ